MGLTVAIPASLVSDIPHLREKTSRLGMIGRALAIFRINEVIVYPDKLMENQRHDAELISVVLRYMETPQYLRKRLFPILPVLKYASILPPLRTPHHPLTKRIADLIDGEYRDGVVVKTGKNTLVDIGFERPIRLNEGNAPLGKRITVKIVKHASKISIQKYDKSKISNIYWGYHVGISNATLAQMLSGGVFDLVILTSKYGKPLIEVIGELKRRWIEAKNRLIVFGSPKQGIREILKCDGLDMDEVDSLVINTIPSQGTKTIRTEEAIFATLAVINLFV